MNRYIYVFMLKNRNVETRPEMFIKDLIPDDTPFFFPSLTSVYKVEDLLVCLFDKHYFFCVFVVSTGKCHLI